LPLTKYRADVGGGCNVGVETNVPTLQKTRRQKRRQRHDVHEAGADVVKLFFSSPVTIR
jgi:hypothetical protein